eukprot:TRINITY_DN82261_c0_g1_i1.p1 TRINITY_DN82261_c0_g1~~TRINITY_DN82261_c0_g1_i1.p1  ORF type:complete len:454 (+),score=100.72 TRINITY_DN82261_c0_g1_i1:25-1362(+)
MFEFDELEAVLPHEAVVVHSAGSPEVNGLYEDTGVQAHGAAIFRHSVMSDQLLAREPAGDCIGWLIGANRRPLYGIRTDALLCPKDGWRTFKGIRPAPVVEGFGSLADASVKYAEVLCQEAEAFVQAGKFRLATEVYKKALDLDVLPERRRAEIHAFRARTFRQLAESKKKVRSAGKPEDENGEVQQKGEADDIGEEDPLHGLAAEWAIEEAEKALEKDPKCFLAGWEGAIAAKHIGWWNKGRILAKKAMQAVPQGPAHRTQRETASTLFLLLAEQEQEEKSRKVQEIQQTRKKEEPDVDPKELDWAKGVITQLNEVLKAEDFKRPHHQVWKLISPGLTKKDADMLFSEIRQLVWEKWNSIAWQHGYKTSWDAMARRKLCARIVDVANTGRAPEVKDLIKEIEDRTCLGWPEIAEAIEKTKYDETWAWTKRADGTWGAWDGPTSM